MLTKCKEIKKKLRALGYKVTVSPHGLYIAKGDCHVEHTCSTLIGLYNSVMRTKQSK